MEKLLKVKYVSLPNLIVNNSVVPELLLHNCTPSTIARELSPLLQGSPKRDWQISGYKNIKRRLGNSVASDYAAELITDSLGLSVSKDAACNEPEKKPSPKKTNRDKSDQTPRNDNHGRQQTGHSLQQSNRNTGNNDTRQELPSGNPPTARKENGNGGNESSRPYRRRYPRHKQNRQSDPTE